MTQYINMPRAYTAAEIDTMREAVAMALNNERCRATSMERARLIEERVRTYMMAGTDADELMSTVTAKIAATVEEYRVRREAFLDRFDKVSPVTADLRGRISAAKARNQFPGDRN